jgi:hypothetical protein
LLVGRVDAILANGEWPLANSGSGAGAILGAQH